MTKRKKRDPLDKLPLTTYEWKRLAKKLGIKWLDMHGIDWTDGNRWRFFEYGDKAGNSGTLTYTLARAIAKLGAK